MPTTGPRPHPVEQSQEISQPFARVEGVLLDGPQGWIPDLRGEESGQLISELLLQVGDHTLARQVVMETGALERGRGRAAVPLGWRAAEHSDLFPVFEGRLEISDQGGGQTRVTVAGGYLPPAGGLGRAADRLLLGRVAQATVGDLVQRLAGILERSAWSAAVAIHPNSVAGPED